MKKRSLLLLACALAGCGDKMKQTSTPDMAKVACPSAPLPDPNATMRDNCTYAAGALPSDTLGISAAEQKAIPIKHIIVLMKENRSFDHLLGQLSMQGQPDAEPAPATFANPDANGMMVARYHETGVTGASVRTCDPYDPPHQWDNMHNMVDGGKMDGFVVNGTLATVGETNTSAMSDGHFTMGYYDQSDMPFLYWLASNFALADHDFASVRSGTWANRDYLVAATSRSIKDTNSALGSLPVGTKLIFDELDTAKVSWQVYTDDYQPLEYAVNWMGRKTAGTTAQFFKALGAGTLESVTFIDATTAFKSPETDEHPPADLQTGEAWTRMLVDSVLKSPIWKDTALIYTYDEAGGFADHVPPGNSCAPSADQTEFTELGVRVPLIVISPYARPKFVSHKVHQHTSITRFIETVFDLPALTNRDANSDALLDMFDFNCPALLTPPSPLPAAGTGGCASPP